MNGTDSVQPEVDLSQFRAIISQYPQERRSLIMVLQDVQDAYGYLPRLVMTEVAARLGVPKSHVFHVATFYKAFSLTPRGAHVWTVCMGTACHVRGAQLLTEHLERALQVQAGDTTDDGEFTLETVNCVGACALGPLAILDESYLGGATPAVIDRVMKRLESKRARTREEQVRDGEEGGKA